MLSDFNHYKFHKLTLGIKWFPMMIITFDIIVWHYVKHLKKSKFILFIKILLCLFTNSFFVVFSEIMVDLPQEVINCDSVSVKSALFD